ncbi:amidohydrolase family protein [Crossiella equi]|uniref:amidohydrolase family protein n=1 Tax=Crossiella equi TaxID=130796 RepID=UPI002012816A
MTALRDRPGVTDIRSAGLPAIGPGGVHAKVLGLPPEAVVLTPEQAEEFVRARVAERVDYVKVVLEEPGAGGPDEETARALVRAAHAAGLKVVAHAASVGAYALAAEVGPDVVTHLPFDGVVREQDVAALAGAGQVVSTTLTMGLAMRGPEALEVMAPSVLALHRAGVPLLAGTDAHDQGALPGVRHGKSLLQELELLARCGLSPVEVLRAATWEPARHFGLLDRGAIRPGLRADAVLVAGDPVQDITTVHNVQKVWCAGQLVN